QLPFFSSRSDSVSLHRQTRKFDHRPDLDRPQPRCRDPLRNANRFIEVLCINEEVSTELLARLSEGPVCHGTLPFPDPTAGCRDSWIEGIGSEVLPLCVDLVRKLN